MILWSQILFALALTSQNPAASPSPSPTPGGVPGVTSPLKSPEDALGLDSLTYTYNPFGKRDPFRPYTLDNSEEHRDSSDPLLNFDLSKFRLTGILSGVANPRAIVKDGDNKGHIIMKGTHIGRNKGSVVSITRDKIVVAEEFRDPLGKLIVSEVTLKLEKEKR